GWESALAKEPSPTLRALVYRITSEAVNNAAKHSQAGMIEVTVESRDGGVWVQVEDGGVGYGGVAVGAGGRRGGGRVTLGQASRSAPGHLGLVSMRERAESAGGWW